jgi:hypothetical protein
MKTSLDLTISCRYSRKLTPSETAEARHILESVARHLADGGMLTGESPTLELDSWRVRVRRTPRRAKGHA